MEQNPTPTPSTYSIFLLAVSWLLSIASSVDKSTVTFVLATVVTVLAGINYVVLIYKNLKSK